MRCHPLVGVARPHPGPLPQGEGEFVSAFGRIVSDWIYHAPVRRKRSVTIALPLTGGEGRGEGERCSNFVPAFQTLGSHKLREVLDCAGTA